MSKAQEAQQFLDDLESLTPATATPSVASKIPSATSGKPGEAADVIAFLDEITQKSSEPTVRTTLLERPVSRAGTPTVRKSTERVRMGAPSPLPLAPNALRSPSLSSSKPEPPTSAASASTAIPQTTKPEAMTETSSQRGWGWGGVSSVWSTASAAIQQARTVVDDQVKNLPNNEQAKKWSEGALSYAKSAQEYAKNAQLDKLSQDFRRVGISTLTDILNVVAPPIAEHEVLQVWLSHDMKGYEGVELVVYRALEKVMEQIEGGDLVVNRGDEAKPKDSADDERDMNIVEGFDAALKLAQAEVNELVKSQGQPAAKPLANSEVPVTYSWIYLRVQPFSTSFSLPAPTPAAEDPPATPSKTRNHLQFILHLVDPAHKLEHTATTQSIPLEWIEQWSRYEWIEGAVVDSLRKGVEVLGQEYLAARMSWLGQEEAVTPVDKE